MWINAWPGKHAYIFHTAAKKKGKKKTHTSNYRVEQSYLYSQNGFQTEKIIAADN